MNHNVRPSGRKAALAYQFGPNSQIPAVTANIYCKSRNLPNTDTQNYSTDLRYLLGHPVVLMQMQY